MVTFKEVERGPGGSDLLLADEKFVMALCRVKGEVLKLVDVRKPLTVQVNIF
jgi:hypothetical protein